MYNPPTLNDSLIISIATVGALILIVSVFFIVKLLMIKPKYNTAPDEDFDEIQNQNSFANITLAEDAAKVEEDTMPKSLRG